MSADTAGDERPPAVASDGGERRRVDLWALKQQAHNTDIALEDAGGKAGRVTNKIFDGDVDEIGEEDFHYAWSAINEASKQLLLLAHLTGYERLDVGAVTWGEATDEEMERFERRECGGGE